MLRVTPSARVVDHLKAIDDLKAGIQSLPTPPPEKLEQLRKGFVLETVYYANKLDGSELSMEDTERALADRA